MNYPKELTNAAWQKNKGVIAKTQGETGIGALLTALEAAHNKVDWGKFTLPPLDKITLQQLEGALAAAGKEYSSKVSLCREQVAILRKRIVVVAAVWAKNKLLSSAKKYADLVASKATAYSAALETANTSLRKELEKRQEEYQKRYEQLNEILETALDNRLAQQNEYKQLLKDGKTLLSTIASTLFTEASFKQLESKVAAFSDRHEASKKKYDALGTHKDIKEKAEILRFGASYPHMTLTLGEYTEAFSDALPLLDGVIALETQLRDALEAGKLDMDKDSMTAADLKQTLLKTMDDLAKNRASIEQFKAPKPKYLFNDQAGIASWKPNLIVTRLKVIKVYIALCAKIENKTNKLQSMYKTIASKAAQLPAQQAHDLEQPFAACEALLGSTRQMFENLRELCAEAESQIKTALKTPLKK